MSNRRHGIVISYRGGQKSLGFSSAHVSYITFSARSSNFSMIGFCAFHSIPIQFVVAELAHARLRVGSSNISPRKHTTTVLLPGPRPRPRFMAEFNVL